LAAIKLIDRVRDKVKEVQLTLFDLVTNLEKVQGMIQFGEQAVDLEIFDTAGGGNCQCKTPHTESVVVNIGEFNLYFIYSENILPKRQGVRYLVTYNGVTRGDNGTSGNGTIINKIRANILAVYGSFEALEEIIRKNTNFDASGVENSNPGFQGGAALGLEWFS
jgi:hypothetical protein